MKKFHWLVLSLIVMVFVLTACGYSEKRATIITLNDGTDIACSEGLLLDSTHEIVTCYQKNETKTIIIWKNIKGYKIYSTTNK